MPQNHRNKLLNQTQIASLGKYISPHRALSDLDTTQDAIHILEDKFNYINKKFSPKADVGLQKGMKMDKGQYVHFKYNLSQQPSDFHSLLAKLSDGTISTDTFMKVYRQIEKDEADKDAQTNPNASTDNKNEHNGSSSQDDQGSNHDHHDNDHNNRKHGSQYSDKPFLNHGNNHNF